MIARSLGRIDGLGRAAKTTAIVALFAVIVVVDAVTGLDLTLRALYLLPVSAAAWVLGRRAALVIAFLCVAASSYFDVALGLARAHESFVYSDATVRLLVYAGAVFVLSRLREAQTRLSELADTDPLTGLHNRRGLERIAVREIARARRLKTRLAVMHLDLDGFKVLNDAKGHAEGDDVLSTMAEVLKASRATDVAARVGGDEFVVFFPNTASEPARTAAQRLVSRLDEAMAAREWAISFSVGVATFAAPPAFDQMIAAADALMYEVKSAGKAAVRYREFPGSSAGSDRSAGRSA